MAEPEFLCVAPELVEAIWPHVAQFIERALIRGRSDYEPDYIEKKLRDAQSLLWIIWDGKKLAAAGTTEICSIVDRDRVVVVTSFGGTLTSYWERFLERIEKYAEEENCSRVRIYGRPGWARFLKNKGYEQPWIGLEKRVGRHGSKFTNDNAKSDGKQ